MIEKFFVFLQRVLANIFIKQFRLYKNFSGRMKYIYYSQKQNECLSSNLKKAEHLVVFLIPNEERISGGLMSIFNLAATSRKLKVPDNAEVLLMTVIGKHKRTYIKQKNFKNNETIFRFEQILEFQNLKKLWIHIPEYACYDINHAFPKKFFNFIAAVPMLNINIMNQNINIMPDKQSFEKLLNVNCNLSQTVAHHRYGTQEICNKFGIPTLLIPAYLDVDSYPSSSYSGKENLIIYSNDENMYKGEIIKRLEKELPDYCLIEINNMTFDTFMGYVKRSKFSITFGEGFDYYFIHEFQKGGVGFAVYNKEFFPSEDYFAFKNIFRDYEDMLENIVERVRLLDNKDEYNELNNTVMKALNKLYSSAEYENRIKRLFNMDFDFYPGG